MDLLACVGVVISRVIIKVAIVMTHSRGLVTPLITTHELPSTKSHDQPSKAITDWSGGFHPGPRLGPQFRVRV